MSDLPSRLSSRAVHRVAALCAAFMLLVAAARPARGQDGLFQRLNLDKLQITSLGISVGGIVPSQVERTKLIAIQADYGEVAPAWRMVFGASYWESRYSDAVVRAFADSLRKSLKDPTDSVRASRISLYDVTFGADLRYTPQYSGEIKPFFGVGLAAHVINAEGPLIKGTFVERSLDDIAAGLYVTTGISFHLISHFGLEGSVRGDLLSGFRSTQARAGATYYFGHVRGNRGGAGDGSATSDRNR